MKKLTLYHNSRCSKSRAALEILEKSNLPFTIFEYLKTPLTIGQLDRLLKQLGIEPNAIVRTNEDEYDELKLCSHPPANREQWLEILTKHPILIERPIVSDGASAVIGRPPERVTEWLKTI